MLNNNIKISLVSFVHHIELQNFLNAPRTMLSEKNWGNVRRGNCPAERRSGEMSDSQV